MWKLGMSWEGFHPGPVTSPDTAEEKEEEGACERREHKQSTPVQARERTPGSRSIREITVHVRQAQGHGNRKRWAMSCARHSSLTAGQGRCRGEHLSEQTQYVGPQRGGLVQGSGQQLALVQEEQSGGLAAGRGGGGETGAEFDDEAGVRLDCGQI